MELRETSRLRNQGSGKKDRDRDQDSVGDGMSIRMLPPNPVRGGRE